MKRETENIVLLLVGISIAVITASGAFTRYVKPGLLPWLAASALLLIALALLAIIGDIRRGGPRPSDRSEAHSHRTGIVWLLVVPILVLIVVSPPALRPSAAAPSVTAVSNVVLNRFPFAPLPPGDAPEVSLPEVLRREVQDCTGSLTNRSITVTGFVLNEAQGVDLGRIVIYCCAADAQLAHIHLRGPAAPHAAGLPDNTWLRVEGQVRPPKSTASPDGGGGREKPSPLWRAVGDPVGRRGPRAAETCDSHNVDHMCTTNDVLPQQHTRVTDGLIRMNGSVLAFSYR